MDRRTQPADRGTILPLTLVFTIGLSVVVLAVATFATTGLRYGRVVEARADRLAAADGGMRYAVGRLSAGAARLCATGGPDQIEAPSLNDATVNVTCGQIGPGFDYTDGWEPALVAEGHDAVRQDGGGGRHEQCRRQYNVEGGWQRGSFATLF